MSAARGDQGPSGKEPRSDALADLEGIFDTVREPLLVLDARLRVQSANRAFYRTFCVTPPETEGQLLYDLGNGQWDIPRLRTLLEEILPENTTFDDYEVEHAFPDIGRKVMLLNARRLRQADRELILLAMEDITERRRAEKERQEIETRFTALVKNIKDHSIFTLDPEGRVTSWNVAAEHILGYSEAEVLGRHFAFIFTPEDRAQGLPEAELRAARDHGRAEDERWHLRKGGERFWALGIVSALYDADGRLTGFSKILRDMTERRGAAEALRLSEEKFSKAFARNAAAMSILHLQNEQYLDVNDAWLKLFGYAREEVLGRTSLQMGIWANPEERERMYGVLRSGKAVRGMEATMRRRTGELRVILIYAETLNLPEGPVIVTSALDITQRKAAERELRESQRRLQAVLESVPAAVVLIDGETGRFSYMNRRAVALYGRDDTGVDLVSHLEAIEVLRPDGTPFPPEALPVMRALRSGETAFAEEMLIRRTSGELLPVSVGCAPLYDDRGGIEAAIAVFDDISALRRAEKAASAAEYLAGERLAELEDLYHNAPVGLCLLDRDLRYLRINQRLAEINGVPVADHIGKTVREVVPAFADMVEPLLGRVVATGEPLLDVEVIGETHSCPGVQRSFLEQWLPVKDADGRVTGISVVVEETTERKRTEAALQETNRRKDAFLATLAHELRNPLAPIRTGLDLLHALRGDGAACEEPLRIMDRQLTHLVRLVDDLLDISRISRGKIRLRKERLDLAEIIDAALDMSETGLSRNDRHITVSVPSEPLIVEGDRVRLVQIVANLLNNAAKFTDTAGHIDLRVLPAGGRVEIRVQDDGRGIARERLKDIFEMFSQAEPGRGGGLGIGLSLVRGLVEMHGGTVSAESEGLGRGASFTVSLPLCRRAPGQSSRQEATETEPPRLQHRVLVVDDNRDIADGLCQLLTLLKAEVRVAYDGADAVRICADWEPTHVLMDLGMPGMDGFEAARRLCADHPQRAFRLIAVSGWGGAEDVKASRAAGFDQHLVKPVGVAELTAALSS